MDCNSSSNFEWSKAIEHHKFEKMDFFYLACNYNKNINPGGRIKKHEISREVIYSV